MLVVILAASGACLGAGGATGDPKPTSPSSTVQKNSADPLAADPARARFVEACTTACERASQMRAVGWQMIQDECKRGCEDDWALPLVDDRAALAKQKDQRIRLRGELQAPKSPTARELLVTLRDRAQVTVSLEGSRVGAMDVRPGPVLLAGTAQPDGTVGFVTTLVAE